MIIFREKELLLKTSAVEEQLAHIAKTKPELMKLAKGAYAEMKSFVEKARAILDKEKKSQKAIQELLNIEHISFAEEDLRAFGVVDVFAVAFPQERISCVRDLNNAVSVLSDQHEVIDK